MSGAAISEPLPERLMLQVSRGYAFLMSLGSLVFLVFGVLVVEYSRTLSDIVSGWAFILFFGLCAMVFALELTVPQISRLELTRDGFRIVYPPLRWNPALTRWNEIAKIEVYRYLGRPWVPETVHVILASPFAYWHKTIRKPWIYGYRAQDLAALMNRFRDRALRIGTSV